MPANITGISILLEDSQKTTPLKQVRVSGMSFSVELRTLDISIVRYDAKLGFVPLGDFPVSLRLLTSNQSEQLSTNASGIISSQFPDSEIELRLDALAVPAGHKAVLNYPIKTQKRNLLTVVFIPDSLRRYYPLLQVL